MAIYGGRVALDLTSFNLGFEKIENPISKLATAVKGRLGQIETAALSSAGGLLALKLADSVFRQDGNGGGSNLSSWIGWGAVALGIVGSLFSVYFMMRNAEKIEEKPESGEITEFSDPGEREFYAFKLARLILYTFINKPIMEETMYSRDAEHGFTDEKICHQIDQQIKAADQLKGQDSEMKESPWRASPPPTKKKD